jgi:hypothetical protein
VVVSLIHFSLDVVFLSGAVCSDDALVGVSIDVVMGLMVEVQHCIGRTPMESA